MVDAAIALFALIFGAVLGYFFAVRLGREKLNSLEVQLRSELESERAVLNEKLKTAESRFLEVESKRAQIEEEVSARNNELSREKELRAALEEKSSRLPHLEETITSREQTIHELNAPLASLQAKLKETETLLAEERKNSADKLALLDQAQQKLSDAFKALSSDALRSNNQSFIDLARATFEKIQESAKGELEKKQIAINELVKPVGESLEKVNARIQEMEKAREGAYHGLKQQVDMLTTVHRELRSETGNLVKALRTPAVRGRWGELQLKRVVEMAGMLEHCDFEQQASANIEDGRIRPDVVVRLPGGRRLVVDAKAPLEAYLNALECQDEAQKRLKMQDHARHIRKHASDLGRKAYWEQFEPAPEFVVLFLPGENFFSAALENDPGLIEAGVNEKVLLATPTTLIALLRAVAYGWKQESLARNAREISELGRDLYKRISDMAGHWTKVGKSLGSAVENYNKAVGSLETRVLVGARKFKELQAGAESIEIEPAVPLEQIPRTLQAPELSENDIFGK